MPQYSKICQRIRTHRLKAHGSPKLLIAYKDCVSCEVLEGLLTPLDRLRFFLGESHDEADATAKRG